MVPSTTTFTVPVGVPDPVPEATVIVMASFVPTAGEVVAAESVVRDAVNDDPAPAGHALKRLLKSIDPKPVAKSYPVPAEYCDMAEPEQTVAPAAEQLLFPLVMSWNADLYVVELAAS